MRMRVMCKALIFLLPCFLSSMEPNSRIPMQNSGKIIRRSIFIFLQNYQYFTSTSSLLALPFSIAILLSQSSPSSLFPTTFNRLHNLFQAAGFPSSSEFFTILDLKLTQTITSSIFALPFTFTFFILAKASVIQALKHHKKPSSSSPSISSILSIFIPLFLTSVCNSCLIISANAAAFCFLFLSFNLAEGFGFSSPNSSLLLSAAGAVVYSIILANAFIICNLALVLSGEEGYSRGFLPFLKACVMIRGRTSTALSLALPLNLALAGIEALFQYRIVRAYNRGQTPASLMVLEGMLIAYMYSIFIVVDTIASCIFFKSCRASSCIDQEGWYAYRIQIAEENNNYDDHHHHVSLKVSQELA